jgi:hypothetical protein
MIQIGTQITMTANTTTGIVTQQKQDEYTQRVLLIRRSGICRTSLLIQPTLIADADTVGIMPIHMRTGLCQWAE